MEENKEKVTEDNKVNVPEVNKEQVAEGSSKGGYRYDSWASQINGMPLSVHLYAVDLENAGAGAKNLIPFTMGQTMNLLYMPFVTMSELTIHTYDFDQKYYGTAKPDASSPEDYMQPPPSVFKLYGTQNIQPKSLGTFKRYPQEPRVTGRRHWSNESKLMQYPYHFVTANDFINTPMILKNELIPANFATDVEVKAYQPITMTGGYTIYVEGYKGDSTLGYNEGIRASAGLDLPTASSEYAQFMATSKAQFQAMNNSASRNEWTTFGRGAMQFGAGSLQGLAGAGQMVMGDPIGGAMNIGVGLASSGNGLMTMIQSAVDRENRIEQSMAKISDLMNAPRNVAMGNCDILSSLAYNKKKVVIIRYGLTPYYKQKLGDYWHLYGYKQNKLMTPNTKSRKYWNYIKTMDAKIQSNAMDKSEIQLLENIYNKGIRFWHAGAGEMHDYEKDNVEV